MTLHEVLQRIQSELTRAMGPLSSAVIEEKVAEFGMTRESLSPQKLPGLVEEASFEIQNHRRKVEFQRAALRILRELPVEAMAAPVAPAPQDAPEEAMATGIVRRKSRLRLAEDPRARNQRVAVAEAREVP
jgi:hypothetical protein